MMIIQSMFCMEDFPDWKVGDGHSGGFNAPNLHQDGGNCKENERILFWRLPRILPPPAREHSISAPRGRILSLRYSIRIHIFHHIFLPSRKNRLPDGH